MTLLTDSSALADKLREWIDNGIGDSLDDDPSGFMLGVESIAALELLAQLMARFEQAERALKEIAGYNSHNDLVGCRCGHRMSMCNAVMAATYCSGHPAAGIASHALGECPPVCWLCIREEQIAGKEGT